MKITEKWTQVDGLVGTGADNESIFARKVSDAKMYVSYMSIYGLCVAELPLMDIMQHSEIPEIDSAFEATASMLMDDFDVMICADVKGTNKTLALDSNCCIIYENGSESNMSVDCYSYEVNELHGELAELADLYELA